MKIIILNGSPKGDKSVTLQYLRFMERHFEEHSFEAINVAQQILSLEKNEDKFNDVLKKINEANLIIWAVPLYVMNVPSQLKKFIELIFERKANQNFKDKYSAVVTTSIHFFDNLAQNYMEGICDDLNTKFIGGYSPDMYDLLDEQKREHLLSFGKSLFLAIENSYLPEKTYPPLPETTFQYQNNSVTKKIKTDKKILILSDNIEDSNIRNMTQHLLESLEGNNVELVKLESIDIKGPCLGCCECGFDNECVYMEKDGYMKFYLETVKNADIIFFCGTILDRHISSLWKKFFDRAFFHTHTPSMTGKQLSFVLSGNYTLLDNMKEFTKAFSQWQRANLVGVVSDESSDNKTIDYQIESVANMAIEMSNINFVAPWSFLGIGGHKIFRDDIWGRLRFVFQADHKYYEENGFYDFPQYDEKAIELNENMMKLTADPEMRIKIKKMVKDQMVAPFKHIAETK